jgi:hypothetical protein
MNRLSAIGLLGVALPAFMPAVLSASPSMVVKRSASMQPVEIRLFDQYAGKPSLKLKIPEAYVNAEFRDTHGRLGAIWLVFWLPDYRPESAIEELRNATPEQRRDYLRVYARNRVRIDLSGEKRMPGHLRGLLLELRERNERVLPDTFGLEHYRNRSCESTYSLAQQGRDPSTRKCKGAFFIEYYIGYSTWSQDDLAISCIKNSPVCSIGSRFHGHYGKVDFPEGALPAWKEYESHAHTFLSKYVITDESARSK